MSSKIDRTASFHLPGLFEFYDFYLEVLKLWRSHREYFYDWCDIGSIYGNPTDCIWGGGRVELGSSRPLDVFNLLEEYGISGRLTFSNSLLKEEHLLDSKSNSICSLFSKGKNARCGVIVHSDLLLDYLKEEYPEVYFVSSTTKVITDFELFRKELQREEFSYVVPDFRLNKKFDDLDSLSTIEKNKVEFLLNECCDFNCANRKACYEEVSRKMLGISNLDFTCKSSSSNEGYKFSKAMENPGFISLDDIINKYLPMGFTNFKIEGRSLGSALLLEFILYYMVKPMYHIHVREALYLDNTLDLF